MLMCLLACAGPAPVLLAAEDIAGQWEMTMDFGGRPSFATLSIAKSPDGAFTGKWGAGELTNVKFDGQKLTFARTVKFGDNEFTMTYAGTLKDGKIAGAFSTDNGEFAANGARQEADRSRRRSVGYAVQNRGPGRDRPAGPFAEAGRQPGRQMDQPARREHDLQRQVPGGKLTVRPDEQLQRQRVQIELRGDRPGRQAHGRLQERAGRDAGHRPAFRCGDHRQVGADRRSPSAARSRA